MKKALFATLLLFGFITNLYGQTGLDISFKVTGATREYALLAYYLGNKQYIKDSAKVAPDGTIVFKSDSVYQPGIYLLVFTPKNDYFEFFIEGNGEKLNIETKAEAPVKFAKVKNSPGNKLFFDYLSFLDKKGEESKKYKARYNDFKDGYPDSAKVYTDKLAKLDKDVLAFQNKMITDNPNSYLACILKGNWSPSTDIPVPAGVTDSSSYKFYVYRSHYWDKFPFLDKRIVLTPILHDKVMTYLDKMTVQNTDSLIKSIKFICAKLKPNAKAYEYAISTILNKYAADKRIGFDAVYVFMVEEYYSPTKSPWVDADNLTKIMDNAAALKPILLGAVAPPLNLPDSNNTNISLASVKATFTFLLFYDPDCGHCKDEIAKLAPYYAKVKSQGVEVYAVSGGDDKQQWKDFVRDNKLTWVNVYDQYKQRKAYKIDTFPQLFVLDKDKKIVIKRVDAEQLIDYMEKAYGILP